MHQRLAASVCRPATVALSTTLATLLLVAVADRLTAQAAPSLERFGLLITEQSRPSFSIVGAGARAAGMGGAFTALADDASASSFNPAGLALLLAPEVTIVADGIRSTDDHLPFRNTEGARVELYTGSSSSFASEDLNFAAFTLPVSVRKRNLAFQLAYHRLIDFTFSSNRSFSESLEGGEPFAAYRQTLRQNGDISTLSLGIAYQLTDRLSLGITGARWEGGWDFTSDTTETELADGTASRLVYGQTNDFSGWNWSAGLLLRYRYLNVGGTIRSGFDGDYRTASTIATTFPTPFLPSSEARGTLHWPTSWTAGIALKPRDTLVFTVDYANFAWSDMELRFGTERANFFDLRPSPSTLATDSEQWRLGAEYTFFAGQNVLAVRGGYFTEPRPQRLVDSRDSSFDGYALGFGWSRGKVSLDVAYQDGSIDSRIQQFVDPRVISSGSVVAQAEGDLSTSERRLFFSFLYRFETSGRLKRALRFLFVGPEKTKGAAEAD